MDFQSILKSNSRKPGFRLILKSNPYHDADGRFASEDGSSMSYHDVQHFRGKWIGANGLPLTPEITQRLKDLGVPPGWKSVQLNADPKAALQATGRDDAGRKQYRYSAEHSEAKAAEKFARVKEFDHQLPEIRKSIASGLSVGDPAAAVLAMIDKTGFRIGSESDTGAKVKAFGITTLQAEHVKVTGDSISLGFVGKAGKMNVKTIDDPELASYVRERLNKISPGDQVFPVSDGQVRSYMKTFAPDFSPKDFRTWRGTSEGLAAVKSLPQPRNEREYQKTRAMVGDMVAATLGNTRAVALSSYIDPAVFAPWQRLATAKKAEAEDLMTEFFASVSYDKTGDWKSLDEDPDE